MPQYEATLGGPDPQGPDLFFGAGRLNDQKASNQTAFTNISYPTENDEKRYEGKLTVTPFPNQALTASYLADQAGSQERLLHVPTPILDLDSLKDRQPAAGLPRSHYSGVRYGSSLTVEGQYSQRHFTFELTTARSTRTS